MNPSEVAWPKLLRSLVLLGLAAFILAATSPVVASADESTKAVVGTASIASGAVFEILPAKHGKVYSGQITILGGSFMRTYQIEVMIEGQAVRITGNGTHMPRTVNQNATFVGESLQLRNISTTDPITVYFAVSFQNAERRKDKD